VRASEMAGPYVIKAYARSATSRTSTCCGGCHSVSPLLFSPRSRRLQRIPQKRVATETTPLARRTPHPLSGWSSCGRVRSRQLAFAEVRGGSRGGKGGVERRPALAWFSATGRLTDRAKLEAARACVRCRWPRPSSPSWPPLAPPVPMNGSRTTPHRAAVRAALARMRSRRATNHGAPPLGLTRELRRLPLTGAPHAVTAEGHRRQVLALTRAKHRSRRRSRGCAAPLSPPAADAGTDGEVRRRSRPPPTS
jgi:hypothetical protein